MMVPTRAKIYIVLNRVYSRAEDQSCDNSLCIAAHKQKYIKHCYLVGLQVSVTDFKLFSSA